MRLVLAVVVTGFFSMACGPSASNEGGDGGIDCPEGTADCDGDPSNGCEADLDSLDDCGECGNVCAAVNGTASCSGGSCVLSCDPGYGNCDFDASTGCDQSLDDQYHCGDCNYSCTGPNAVGECVNSSCEMTCADGYGDCNDDFTDGCESVLDTDEMCGSCGHGCTTSCVDGACETCDDDAALDSSDPFDAARAMGICDGLIDARWVLPDGTEPPENENFALGYGNLSAFGPNVSPREGAKMLGLSSGAARQPSDPGYEDPAGFDKNYGHAHPDGFPKESPSCDTLTGTGNAYDGVALEVELQAPEWAHGIGFDFNFYTYEWPTFVCSQYNDFFVALLQPIPEGQDDGNISFDSMGNPVSVNNAFVSVCGCDGLGGPPCMAGGKSFDCENGTAELQGTGFEGDSFSSHAATSWLTTRAPIEPGSVITLRLAVYDSGDGVLDSTTLIDNFHWVPEPPDVGTEPID